MAVTGFLSPGLLKASQVQVLRPSATSLKLAREAAQCLVVGDHQAGPEARTLNQYPTAQIQASPPPLQSPKT